MTIGLPKCPEPPKRSELWYGAHTAVEQDEYEAEVKEWNRQYAKWLKLMKNLITQTNNPK